MERRLATILAIDVVGYSRLMRKDEEGTLAGLIEVRQLIDRLAVEHGGRTFGAAGDSVLAEFSSPVEAVKCSIDIQQAITKTNTNRPKNAQMQLRIGVNIGDVMDEKGTLYGDGINVAARLESLCKPGGMCISGAVYEHVRDRIDIKFKDVGEKVVKNIDRPVRVWRWVAKPVSPFMVLLDPSNSKHQPVASARTKQRLHPMVLSATLIVVMALAGGVFWLRPWDAKGPEQPQAPTTNNLEAYDYFLRAEKAAQTGSSPQLRRALIFYEKATELDPLYSKAFAADARIAAYVLHNNYDDVLPGPVARKRAYEHASRALQIDPEASLPYSVLAILQATDGRHDAALKSAERAVALDPGLPDAQAALSRVLTFSGRHTEAVAAIEIAIKLNPDLQVDSLIYAGFAFLLNDQPELAIKILERARVNAPNVDDIYVMLTAAYTIAGLSEAAQTAAAAAVRLSPNICVELFRVTFAHLSRNEDLTKFINALAAGGLPRWPYTFSSESRERLTVTEMKSLAFGRTWQGKVDGGGTALMDMKHNGDLVFRTMTRIATGKAFISGDMLCERFASSSLDRPMCGPVYATDLSFVDEGFAYTYVNGSKVFHFSPVE